MKVLVLVVSVLLLAGCGTYTPMEELERQALLTGDWSAVEKREKILQRRRAGGGMVCPSGKIAVCDGISRTERCTCLDSDNVRSILAGL